MTVLVVTAVVLVAALVISVVRGERARQHTETTIQADTRDAFVMAAAEDEMDEVDR